MHSPRAACHSNAADRAVVRARAMAATTARAPATSCPNARAPRRNPASTSSPAGVRPGPRPSSPATAAAGSVVSSLTRLRSIPTAAGAGSALSSAASASAAADQRGWASAAPLATAAAQPRCSGTGRTFAGAHSRTARTTTGPAAPVQVTQPSPTTASPAESARHVNGNSAALLGSTSAQGSRIASVASSASAPGVDEVRRYKAAGVTPSQVAGRAGPASAARNALLAAASSLTPCHPEAGDDWRHALGV